MQDDDAGSSASGDEANLASANPTGSSAATETKPVSSLVDMSVILPLYNELSPIASNVNTLVFAAVANQAKRKVAIKRISLRSCSNISVVKNMLREVKILRRLDHDNVVRIYNVVLSTLQTAAATASNSTSPSSLVHPKTSSDDTSTETMSNNVLELPYDALYLEMELVDIDLRGILEQRTLSLSYVKLFSYQLLRGLKYVHSANVMHRDLSPSNIFINIDTLMLKIGDFGVSRVYDSSYDHTRHMSVTASSTWYQAPEMMVTPGHYDTSVDVWAAGCIIAEMLTGTPLFPGTNVLEQIELICESIDNSHRDWNSMIAASTHRQEDSHAAQTGCCSGGSAQYDDIKIPDSAGRPPAKSLTSKLGGDQTDADMRDLISQMLVFDGKKRISVKEALLHPAFNELRCLYDEPVCHHPFHIEDELDDFSLVQYQELLKMGANELVSVDSSGVGASNDDLLRASAKSSVHSVGGNPSNKNLLELVRSGASGNSPGSHLDCAMSESEARKMACDFQYGVQIDDGHVNRERMRPDWRPVSPETACFDPYKWNNDTVKASPTTEDAHDRPRDVVLTEKPPMVVPLPPLHQEGADHEVSKTTNKQAATDQSGGATGQDAASHSDHGYHSSYCSSNLSNGKPIHSHSLWSLSSPDVSIDHEHRGTRALTPDVDAAGANNTAGFNASSPHDQEQSLASTTAAPDALEHISSRFQSPTASVDEMEAKWKHKDDVIPHHHQSYQHHHHHYHHHHHGHHHHHHHHKHHRHTHSRHTTSSLQSGQRAASTAAANVVGAAGNNLVVDHHHHHHHQVVATAETSTHQRVHHQRRCLVEEVVQELSEENSSCDQTMMEVMSTETTTLAPSTGCKREKKHHHHHHHHRSSSKKLVSINQQQHTDKPSTASDNEAASTKREPGYHERLLNTVTTMTVELSDESTRQRLVSDKVDNDKDSAVSCFPVTLWTAAANSPTPPTSSAANNTDEDIAQSPPPTDEGDSKDENSIFSSVQQRLKSLQAAATVTTCASQSRVESSFELASLHVNPHNNRDTTVHEQKKAAKRRGVQCHY